VVLNFYHNIGSIQQLTFLYLLVNVSFNLNISFTNVHDLFARVLLNDFYLNSFYYVWTSFWYIPLFLLLIILYFALKHVPSHCYWKYILFASTAFLLSLELLDYWLLNLDYAGTFTNSDYFNNLLSNSINKYHPGLFYLTSLFTLLIFTLLHYLTLFSVVTFSGNQLKVSYLLKFATHLILITFALFLGGWWALQEGSWGGWWNWDPSEVFGMLFIFNYSYALHQGFLKKGLHRIFLNNTLFIYGTLLIYFFIQLNFDLVSHNFGTKVNQFIDVTQFFLLSLLTIAFFFGANAQRSIYYFSQTLDLYGLVSRVRKLYKSDTWRVWGWTVAILLSYQIILTFSPLINDFVWKAFQINIINSVPAWTQYNLLLVLNLCIFFWAPSVLSTLLFLYILFNISYTLLFLPAVFFRRQKVTLIHLILLAGVTLSIINSIIFSTHWSFPTTTLSSATFNQVYFYYTTVKLNNDCLDLVSLNCVQNCAITVFNFLLVDTTPEIYSFFFQLSTNFQQQSLSLGNLLFYYTVNTFDILPQSLINGLALWALVTTLIAYNKKLIIF
jgi:hypothetical protein